MDLIPGSGIPPGGGHGNPFQYSCLENSSDRGAWWATIHGGGKESDVSEQLTLSFSIGEKSSSLLTAPTRVQTPQYKAETFTELWLLAMRGPVCKCYWSWQSTWLRGRDMLHTQFISSLPLCPSHLKSLTQCKVLQI